MKRAELTDYLNTFLKINSFKDYCPNGLQVSGKDEVKKIVTGVTACQALLDAAVKEKADAILVHHGYFWKGEDPCVTGIKRQRIATLLAHDINLYGYHLPLDSNPTLGNNAKLGQSLNFTVTSILNDGLLYCGELTGELSANELAVQLEKTLQHKPQVIAAGNRNIKTIAWCTGAAQDLIEQVALLGIDAFISGEISERTYHIAREYDINYFAAGHHATERFGIKALGEHLAEKFSVEVSFVDIMNPI
jgi:dinuclear metal center YbgI/SA1388 family protein